MNTHVDMDHRIVPILERVSAPCAAHVEGRATWVDRLAEELDTVVHGTTYITL